jgi:hypothetical protein
MISEAKRWVKQFSVGGCHQGAAWFRAGKLERGKALSRERSTQRRHRRLTAVLAITICTALGMLTASFGGGVAAAACGGFEDPCSHETAQQFAYGSVQREDTPNDPSYDQAEPDTQQPPANRSSNFYSERFDLFGFPSQLTPSANYLVGPNAGKPMVAGFNAAGAWKAERGRADAVIAILDDGFDWSERGLRDQIHLSAGELPYPEHANGSSCGAYDCDGNGVLNVDDYAEDPRVSLSYSGRTGPAALITAQDLIHAFGNCRSIPAVTLSPRAHPDSISTTMATAMRTTSPAGTSSTTPTTRPTPPATSPRTITGPAAPSTPSSRAMTGKGRSASARTAR